jgi:hypothetical protein
LPTGPAIRPLLRFCIAVIACALATACGQPTPTATPTPTPTPSVDAGLGGMGLPQQLPGERYPGADRELAGTVELQENGCINVVVNGESLLAIWPAGSALDDLVRLPDGTVLADGDTLTAAGSLTPTAPLVADRNGYWANVIGFCAPDAKRVVVLDAVRSG